MSDVTVSEPQLVRELLLPAVAHALEHPMRERQLPAAPEVARYSAMVPKRFASATLDNYVAETESERYALRAIRRWVEVVVAGGGPMVAIIGPQGTGKSHLMYGAYWALYAGDGKWDTAPRKPPRPSCFSWYRLADELRWGGTNPYNGAKLESHEVRDRLWGAKIIMLDEVRPTANTNFDDTELAKVACHCYDAEIPMLLTTNVAPLADVLGGPAASRFTQIIVTGRDRRQTDK